MTDQQELAALEAALLSGLPVELPAVEPSFAALERRQLLAIRIHRAARLNAPNKNEDWPAWLRYFQEHFARGDQYAKTLWVDWRVSLVKDEHPGPRVSVSHGQPHRHWTVDEDGRLFIDLESMWDDYETSVQRFMKFLAVDSARRAKALVKWRERQWRVEEIRFADLFYELADPATPVTTTASVATGMAIRLPPRGSN